MASKRRDNRWLLSRLIKIWQNHFTDVEVSNQIKIKFSRSSQYRFGSIRLDKNTDTSLILINGRFRDFEIPDEIVDHTIAHELAHYTHGFSSPRGNLYKHPHKGGVIDKEMRRRGLGHLIPIYKIWLKTYIKSLH